jgi:ferredoxin
MSVVLTFEPSGVSGVVAPGTYLIDASRRLGVSLGPHCTRGSQNHYCLIRIGSGGELLSTRSYEEEKFLTGPDFDSSYRLGCQVKIESPGEVTINVTSRTVGSTPDSANDADVRKKFSELTLQKKIATLLQLEAITVSEALDAAIEKPLALGSRAFDSVMKRARAANAQKTSKTN